MDMRELKGLELAARSRIVANEDGTFIVPSQTGSGTYRVNVWASPSCTCPDFELTQKPCKHVHAAKLYAEREGLKAPAPIVVDEVPKKKTYKQNWPLYNLAQTTEKDRFQEMLYDLCAGVEEPPRHVKGGKRIWMKDVLFACAYKVFTLFSTRRYMSDLRDAHDDGLLGYLMNPSTVMDFINSETITPYLYQLIERSAWPLRAIESTFAPDSTGFSTSRHIRWHDEKWGKERSGRAWVKAHIMTGVKTNIVTTAIIDSPTANDMPMLHPMLERTLTNGFTANEVCADKGYLSKENLEIIVKHNAVPYIPFKVNSVPGEGGTLWSRLLGFFQFNREQFLARYHQRSNVESTFAMVKAKFGDSVRTKTDVAMKNEALLKLLCHNIVVVHQSVIELGIEGTFWPEEPAGERNVIRMSDLRRNQTGTDGITGQT